MTIKQIGGVFGRNPEYNTVTVADALSVNGAITIDQLSIDGRTITSTDTNGNVVVQTNGTGTVCVGTAANAGGGLLISEDYTTAYAEDLGGDAANYGTGSYLNVRSGSNSSTTSGISLITRSSGLSKWDILNVWQSSFLGDLVFRARNGGTSSAEIARMKSGGDVEIKNGNLVIGTSGKGIDFSATAGTGTSELFDDYEEGTWTPTYLGSTTNPTNVVYVATNSGSYTKIGNVVHVSFYLFPSTWTPGTGDFLIGGLPYAANSTAPLITMGSVTGRYIIWDSATYEYLGIEVRAGENYIRLMQYGSNTDLTAVPVTAISSGGTLERIYGSITYFV